MRAMRKLPVVPICRNPAVLRLPPNQPQIWQHPVPARGAYRDRHGRWVRDAMDAVTRKTSEVTCGRQNRVVLTPRRWRQVGGDDPQATVAKEPGHRGEHEGNR